MRFPRLAAVGLAIAAQVGACTASAPSSSGPAESSPSASATSAGSSPSSRSPDDSAPAPTAGEIADPPPPVALQPVAEGLVAPIGIATAPGGWLIVNEQAGHALSIDPANGETVTTLDIRDRVGGGGERGLLGLVLHPNWPADGRAFVHYSDSNGNTVLSEFSGTQEGAGPPVLDPESERVLLTAEQPFGNHNGGQLVFGPDGYLWMALGDGGSGGDPLGNGQNPMTLLGSILRLDVATGGGYAIPDDNPFADGTDGAPEVYLFGLRNPWRFSFDRATGELWIADVGQGAYEEVNRLDPDDAGANLGWNTMEGAHCFSSPDCSTDGLVLPVAEYGRDLGCSVTGGHVYRGAAINGLAGWYLMADYCSGRVFGVRSDASASEVVTPTTLLETGASITAIGSDDAGELYVADVGSGTVSRIVAGG
ncbi:MAG: PQQ-dependent sugar dehydrogenase [Candidatus Limnocylindria bacterium]